MQNYVIIRQIKPLEVIPQSKLKPMVKYIGPKEKGEAIMFRIIMNSEGNFKKIQNENGLEVEVNENILIPNGKKNASVNVAVSYFFYPGKEEN